jgi:hypothetical protein
VAIKTADPSSFSLAREPWVQENVGDLNKRYDILREVEEQLVIAHLVIQFFDGRVRSFQIFRCFPVSIIPPKLHTHIYLYAAFIRTSGRLWGPSDQVMLLQISDRMKQKNTLAFFVRFLTDTIHVRCVANKVAMGKLFVRVIRFSSLSIFPSVLQIRLHLYAVLIRRKPLKI